VEDCLIPDGLVFMYLLMLDFPTIIFAGGNFSLHLFQPFMISIYNSRINFYGACINTECFCIDEKANTVFAEFGD